MSRGRETGIASPIALLVGFSAKWKKAGTGGIEEWTRIVVTGVLDKNG